MAETDFKTIDEYISAFPEDIQVKLERIRQTIRKAAPESKEVISYQMPTFRLNGILVHFAAFTNHISFFPTPSAIVEFEEELTAYETSKGTIKFPNGKPIPYNLITQIVEFRVKENHIAEKASDAKKANTMDPPNTKDREIRLSREFDAPRELVFDAFSTPEKIGQWWGPDGFTTTTAEMNFKVGGDWIFTMHGPDGTDYPNHIAYTEIKEPERITYDHYGHEDEEGDPPHFKATIVFEDLGERTKINMHMLFPSVEKRKEAAGFGAVEGGKQTLSRLASFLQQSR